MVQLKPPRTWKVRNVWKHGRLRCGAHLVKNWFDYIVKEHSLVCCRRENLVELVCLVAERAGTHGELDILALDALGLNNNTAVFAQLAVIATSATHNYIDICLVILLLVVEIALLSLSALN
jgi:hypothetical protein